MRKLLVLMFLMMALPASALAEPRSQPLKVPEWTSLKLEKPGLKFQKKKLWNLVALPAYLMLETTIHEGSHGVMGKSYGLKIVSFKPYPHRVPGYYFSDNIIYVRGRRLVGMDWQPGVSYFGAVLFSGRTLSPAEEAMVLVAPYMADVALFIATDLALAGYLVDPKSIAGLILYTAGMVAPFVNFTYNAHNVKDYTDFGRLSVLIGKNNFAGQVFFHMGVRILILAAISRLWVRGRDVFLSETPKQKLSRITIVPLAGSMNGAGMGFQF